MQSTILDLECLQTIEFTVEFALNILHTKNRLKQSPFF